MRPRRTRRVQTGHLAQDPSIRGPRHAHKTVGADGFAPVTGVLVAASTVTRNSGGFPLLLDVILYACAVRQHLKREAIRQLLEDLETGPCVDWWCSLSAIRHGFRSSGPRTEVVLDRQGG